MHRFELRPLLERWSAALLADPALGVSATSPGWVGQAGASREQLAELEARLGRSLPPSYRAFLSITNGWPGGRLHGPLLPAERVAWLRDGDPEWIDAWCGDGELAEADLEGRHLPETLMISEPFDGQVFLLNPAVIAEDAEWEAWSFATWHPGASPFESFAALLELEAESARELASIAAEEAERDREASGRAPRARPRARGRGPGPRKELLLDGSWGRFHRVHLGNMGWVARTAELAEKDRLMAAAAFERVGDLWCEEVPDVWIRAYLTSDGDTRAVWMVNAMGDWFDELSTVFDDGTELTTTTVEPTRVYPWAVVRHFPAGEPVERYAEHRRAIRELEAVGRKALEIEATLLAVARAIDADVARKMAQ